MENNNFLSSYITGRQFCLCVAVRKLFVMCLPILLILVKAQIGPLSTFSVVKFSTSDAVMPLTKQQQNNSHLTWLS